MHTSGLWYCRPSSLTSESLVSLAAAARLTATNLSHVFVIGKKINELHVQAPGLLVINTSNSQRQKHLFQENYTK